MNMVNRKITPTREKCVQITEQMFSRMLALVLLLEDVNLPGELEEIRKEIYKLFEEKCASMERRATYTEYKTTEPGADREALRKKYLELAGITPGFISKNETPQ